MSYGHRMWIRPHLRGSDLTPEAQVEDHKLRRSKAKCPTPFQAANGNTKGMEVVVATMNIVEFDEAVEPYVLPHTPAALSISRRCTHEGSHFARLSGKHPYLSC